MQFFSIGSDDARWLGRWLRGNLIGVTILGFLALTIGSDVPGQAVGESTPPELADPQSDYVTIPEGWRRTSKGWEHTSDWPPAPRPLGDWIESQQQRETPWVGELLSRLRRVHPLAYALGQVSLVATIVVVMRRPTKPVNSTKPVDSTNPVNSTKPVDSTRPVDLGRDRTPGAT